MRRPRVKDVLVAFLVMLLGLLPGRPPRRERPRLVPPGEPSPRAELLAIALFFCAAALAVSFVAVYALDRLASQTQWMGLTLGLAFLAVAAALIVVGKRVIVTEELAEDYPPQEHPEDEEVIVALVEDSGTPLTRRRLFKLSLVAAGGALAVALLAPVASLGPVFDVARFTVTPWRRGRRLVDESGRPYRAADIEEKTFYTAFPEGAEREQLGAPLILVRLAPGRLQLPPELAGYDARGIVAYSKICTHAGCAISLYRAPLYPPSEPGPALVCPCHYSTFDPSTGGTVMFGPAGRKLPMLPIYVDARGEVRARGNFDGPVGPSWWGVRSRNAT
jgi:quinol---cytochrome c reductase iron-sulfur subunit